LLAPGGADGQDEVEVKIGTGELIFLLVILAIVFSASRMSALGNALGKFVYSFKKANKGEGFVDAKVTRLPKQAETDAEIVEDKKRG
jgi:sec-independent protein translocase protein TatA